jgi:hypothetical protein
LSSCYPINSEKDVGGRYELVAKDVKIVLDVAADHTYAENVEFKILAGQRTSGTWRWTDGKVCFDAFLVPEILVPGLFQMVPPEGRPRTVGHSYQFDQCVGAGVEYGNRLWR